GHPEFSHDGTMIAFDSDRDGDSDIYTVPVTGGTPFQVQNQVANEKRPTWSPDDTEIAFDSDAASQDIWRVAATGGPLTQVTSHPALDNDAEYSADGSMILFDSNRTGSIHVFIVPTDGGVAQQLTTVSGPNFDPEWSPDFTQIAFNSGRGVSQDVWIMPPSGEPAVQVTNGPGVDAILAWSPDGTQIAFVSDRLGQKEIYVVDLDTTPPPPSSDLAMAKSVDDPAPFEDDTVVYTVSVTNNGTLDNSGIDVADVLPAGVTFVSALPSQGSYSAGTGIWSVGSLIAGASASLDLTVTVNPGTAGQTVTNTASVTAAAETDPVAFNNSASVDIDVQTVQTGVVFTQLVSGGVSDQRPAWSPDGQIVICDSNRAGNRDLWYVAAGGGTPNQLTFNKKFDGQPEYHPDGSRVVFSAVANAGSDLYTKAMPPPSPTLSLLIDPSSADRYPEYSPDGLQVVIDKASDIYQMPAAGGAPSVLVTNPANEGHPAYSPDGQWVAYNSDRMGSVDIWVVPAAGGAEIQMTTSTALDGTADWSPDGQWIAFHSDRDGQAAIWAMPFNGGAGGTPVKLSDGGGADTQPNFSPDGTEIAFSRNGDIWKMSNFQSLLSAAKSLPDERPVDLIAAARAGSAMTASQNVDLEMRAAVDRIDPAEGDEVIFEVTVVDVSAGDATGVQIEQILPPGLTLVSSTATDGTYNSAAANWTVPALVAGASAVLEIHATVDFGTAGQTIASSSTVSTADQPDLDGTNDSDWVQMVIGAGADPTPAVIVQGLPTEFSLAPARPNPFRSSTTFQFDLPRAGYAELVVFDVTGRRVKTLVRDDLAAGRFDAVWDGRDEAGARTAPGVYFVRLQTQGFGDTRKAVRLD
ncbi:MAG TPA: FlgD immunoglobulin-like domain containing protein, partial [bacterium]|nr:FlgD immunoglobulin-like domain containing protein [bacterium]